MAFTEFCCRSGGSNMNGGALASNGEPSTSAVYSATNGGWNSSTGVFTPTSGNPSLSVTVGDFAHVFTDGSTTPTFIGRVTAVSSTTITVSTTAKGGTAPTTAGTGISINVGGAWAGPSGSSGFPFNFVTTAMQSAGNARPRVNYKNDQTYNITATIAAAGTGPYVHQGYSSTFGDLGKATIDGGTSGASYALLTVANTSGVFYADLIFQNNGATGNTGGIQSTNTNSYAQFFRVVVHDVRGSGFATGGNSAVLWHECEAYNCNAATGGNRAGFDAGGGGTFSYAVRCISHDNTGHGFSAINVLLGCIADSNTLYGSFSSVGFAIVKDCDFYNNTQHGVGCGIGGTANFWVENCNFIKNGQYGLALNNGATLQGQVINCGFGSGTQANTSGAIVGPSNGGYTESGTVTYAANVTPWVDPANGDFRVNLATAKNAGRGVFTQTAASYAGTAAYPDIGAAQHQDTGGGGGTGLSRARAFSGFH